MNLTQLETDCKKEGRKCFENFKHFLLNYPFDFKIDEIGVANTILQTIEQEFGRAVLKKHITGKESKVQLQLMKTKVDDFEKMIVKTSWNWARKTVIF